MKTYIETVDVNCFVNGDVLLNIGINEYGLASHHLAK